MMLDKQVQAGKIRHLGISIGTNDNLRQTAKASERNVGATLHEVWLIKQNEVPEGIVMVGWALAWCLQHPAVTCVIPGCKSPEQVEANAKAAALNITKNDHTRAWRD